MEEKTIKLKSMIKGYKNNCEQKLQVLHMSKSIKTIFNFKS